jgi:hypothetical protein
MTTPTAAQKACAYLLNRIQTDPDVGYYLGFGTQSFDMLCAAEAEFTGKTLEEVQELRGQDLQPAHRKREPKVLELEARVEELQEKLDKLGGGA